MARRSAGRFLITGQLIAQTPLHVGGHGQDVDTDLPLARDGADHYYVPGTSLAGALRAFCQRTFPEGVDAVWGFQGEDDAGAASHVVVEDAPLPETVAEIRDGVGIDRAWGAAADGIKYDRAVLPRGSRLPLVMSVEFPQGKRDSTLDMLTALLRALEGQAVRLGAAKTRGLGRLQLTKTEIKEQDLQSQKGILAVLRGQSETLTLGQVAPHSHPRIDLTIHWQPRGPLMVKAGYEGVAVDMLPLTSAVEGGVSLVLPGSSVKGAIRGQAERIVRTLRPHKPLADIADGKRRFLKHLAEHPLIEWLFGAAGKSKREQKVKPLKGELQPGLGALGVDDCYAARPLSRDEWAGLVAATNDTEVRSALTALDAPEWQQAYHVAVDRWTGGAADQFLYTVLEPHRVTWEPLRWSLDLARLPDTEQLPAVALLLLVLRDLGKGRLPLGFATHRGMGAVAVTEIVLEPAGLTGPLAALPKTTLKLGDLSALPAEVRTALNDGWEQWRLREDKP